MVAKRHRARWTNLLPLAALALLLPMQRASASSMEMSMPSRNQIRQYKLGLEAWEVALNESDSSDRLEMLDVLAPSQLFQDRRQFVRVVGRDDDV